MRDHHGWHSRSVRALLLWGTFAHCPRVSLRRTLRLASMVAASTAESPQEKARTTPYRKDGGASRRVARAHQGPSAGLHKLGEIRKQPKAVGGQPGGVRRAQLRASCHGVRPRANSTYDPALALVGAPVLACIDQLGGQYGSSARTR